MAKPMSKSKIVATLAEKLSTKEKPVSKKHIVAFFDELLALAVKECKGGAGKFVIPIKIKAKTVVRLRASKAFKDAILS
jgi:nucleoid DNA-binding protein